MRKSIIGGFVLGCLTLATPAASAQSFALRASIPFEFNIGSGVFPAGDYLFTKNALNPYMIIQSTESPRHNSIVMVNPTVQRSGQTGSDDPTLTFALVHNRHFFRQAWRGGKTTGAEALVSPFEKQFLQQAGNQAERVALRASLK